MTKYVPKTQPIIKKSTIELRIPNKDKETGFIYPFEYGDYLEVGKKILSQGMEVSTGDEIASLLHHSYFYEFKYFPEYADEEKVIKEVISNDGFWVYNLNILTDKGIFVCKDLNALGEYKKLNIKKLEEKILMKNQAKEIDGVRFSEDGLVRFAPKGSYFFYIYNRQGSDRTHSIEELSEDGFILASFGKKGRKQLTEISSELKEYSEIFGPEEYIEERNLPIQGVSWICFWDGVLKFQGFHNLEKYSGYKAEENSGVEVKKEK
ncbi:MAG: hypothetical protein WC812_02315 [Candidatus Pacearchaeota archaeon]|jgi:hypothetical protein